MPCVFQFFDAVGVVIGRILQSAGFARFVMTVQVSLFWLLFLPLAFLAGPILKLGVLGTWSAFVVYLVSNASIMVVWYIRGDWLKGKV